MATPLPATPWIKSYDTPELFLSGYSQGSQAAQARARLQAAQQEAQARLAAAQQEAERDAQMKMQLHQQNSMMEEQKIAIENQYRQTQIGLAREKAQEDAKMNEWKIAQAAREAASKMELSRAIQSGEDPVKAMMRLGPQAGLPMGGMATLAKSQKEIQVPENVKTWEEDGEKYYWTGSRAVHVPRMREEQEGELSQKARAQISSLKADEKILQAKIDRWDIASSMNADLNKFAPKDRPRVEALKQEGLAIERELEKIRAQRKMLEGFGGGDGDGWKEVAPGFRIRVRK